MTHVDVATMTMPAPPLLLPDRRRPVGPRVGRLLRRAAAGIAVVWIVGMLPALLDAGHRLTAFGLGLWFPGAGFLYSSDLPLLAISLAAFAVAFVAWFGSGNIVAPVAVWLGAAFGAAARANTGPWEWAVAAVPAIAIGVAATGLGLRERSFRAARRRAKARNAYLAGAAPVRSPAANGRSTREASVDDLGFARFALDLALQAKDEFTGYQFLDQFQTAAVRYQLNFNQYALAHYQATCAPAFRGYLMLAQRNLIEKMTNPRVWRYWRVENLLGNLDLNADPIRRDNIMLSGYLGLMVGLYQSANGDARYREPGAIAFQDGKRRYAYDFDSICEALADNFRRSDLGQFACEPNWVYSACNTTGFNSLVLHDRLAGTSYVEELYDSYRRSVLEEFTTTDGRMTAIRSSRLGFTIPSLTSTMADAGTVYWMTPTLADVANRTWAILRREFLRPGADGRPVIALRGWDRIDTGTYRPSLVTAHVMCLTAAREMGDEEIATQLQAAIDATFEPRTVDGVTRYEKASTFANLSAVMGRFNRVGGWAHLVSGGPDPQVQLGPHLADAPYPQVLVARADTDGAALDLVLHPGGERGRYALGLAGLRPSGAYSLAGASGESVVAGGDGTATIHVDLDGRRAVTVTPEV